MLNKLFRNRVLSDLILIFLLAFAIRLAFIFVIRPITIGSPGPDAIDPESFGVRATNILEGRGYSDADGTPTVWREPLYPFFMAGVWALGGQSEEIIQVANSALGGLAAALTYLLAYYSFGRGVGFVAALLYSCFPLNIWYVPLYRYEALFTPLVALCGVFYTRLRERLHWWDAVLMGVVLGLTTLNSQLVLLMPLVFIVASLESPRWKQLLARVVVATLVMGVVIFPWTLRNYIVTGGEFIIVRQGGPANFLLGNYAVDHYDEAPMQLTPLRELAKNKREALILDKTGAVSIDEVDPIEREKIWGQEVTNFLKTQPGQFVRKVIVQAIRFWYLGDTFSKSIFILSIQLPLLIMALLGIIQAIRHRKPFVFYLLTIAYFNSIYAVMWVEARYTVPLEPYVMTLASYGLLSLTPVLNSVERFRLAFRQVRFLNR
jgi:4-amino-4-deoxy-L-arabinose transferase-like glycosyltransferase